MAASLWPSERKAKYRVHRQLLRIGIAVWDGSESKKWEEHKIDNVRSIKRFLDEEGRFPSKRAKVGVVYEGSCPSREDEVKLGNAVQNFQQECKKGYMSDEVRAEAEAIPALWARIQPQPQH
eukprot:TRINITY_DN11606_c0_g1_i1.p1 TRINITY_DN11606_c0_g1~~TRINITY_DN11606_c0_g1_i1.p1  ORF type:complete len:122 (+),score=27.91 TRINITY_DN11606_c0_g1_i1:81-446(+)